MGINAQPSSVDAQGNGLYAWLAAASISVAQAEGGAINITKDDYTKLLSTDPWLEQFSENGILTLVDSLKTAGVGNEDSNSSSAATDNPNTSAPLPDRLQAAGIAYTTSEADATGRVIYYISASALAAIPAEDPLLVYVASGQLQADDAGNVVPAVSADSGAAAGTDVGNGGTAPDANMNSGDATDSVTQSDASDTSGQNGSSSQDSGSSSDAPQSSNSPSATGDDAPAPSPVPVVTPVTPVEPAVNTQPVTESSSAVAWLEEFAKTASVDAKAIVNAILTYVKEMAPGKSQTAETIQRQQVNLNSALSGAINRLDGEFKSVWGGILRLAHEHRDGVFHDRYIFRQLQNAPLNSTQRAFFERTMNMIKLTADPQGRKAGLKQFDKDRTMQHGMTEAGRNRLLAFYDL